MKVGREMASDVLNGKNVDTEEIQSTKVSRFRL